MWRLPGSPTGSWHAREIREPCRAGFAVMLRKIRHRRARWTAAVPPIQRSSLATYCTAQFLPPAFLHCFRAASAADLSLLPLPKP